MDQAEVRAALAALALARGESLAALSRLIGRNAAYLQQFVTRGSPRALHEQDRRVLAAYLGVAESVLGAPPSAPAPGALVRVPRIDAVALAGPGGLLEGDRALAGEAIDPALLRQWGVAPASLSIITARGDSMLPTIADGDDMWVDRADVQPSARGGIYVVRLAAGLVVKRLVPRDGSLLVTSDNPEFPPFVADPEMEIIGRVVRLTRLLK
ncbi:MAG: S24 family peptidase [Sphingomonas sp.]|nr:S24 family peptidase [Sphingomonas sp.]